MERSDAGQVGDNRGDPMIGRVLDARYRVGPRIARGGMATVYEATDLRLDRTVAVKIMHAGLGDDGDFVSRFEREARSAARLAHHNVVAVFDQGEDRGTLFLVMEYVPGLTLRDLIRKEAPMSPSKALSVIEPVLSALAAAHGAGMIHRDVKPENVLLADDGRVKVADFGLARAVNSETQHTATGGVLIGTVSYLSPELVVDGKADARSDVYAAGVVLYEMLTGAKPHQAESPIQVAYKHVHEDVPPPSAAVAGIPSYVDALVARATARDQDMRPADAKVLLHQVRRVRLALDHGVVDDPELTADLSPTGELPVTGAAVGVLDDDATQAVPRVPRVPSAAAVVPRLDHERPEPVRVAPTPRQDRAPRPPRTPREPRAAIGRSRRGPVLLAGLLVLALLVGLGGWYFGSARYTVTPGVLNLTEAAAEAKVEAAGLGFDVDRTAFSETVPRGSVISTDPEAGSRIPKDGTVNAVISKGPERHKVPDARGKTLNQAQDLLAEANLGFGREIRRFHETVARGRVIALDPRVGTPLKRDSAVNVIVSRGPRPIEIPDFTGRPAELATDKLTELGFEVSTDEAHDDTVAEGRVISQSPDEGTGRKGDEINLVVSLGPEMVEIPRVRGLRVAAAKKLLEEAGFEVRTVRSSVYVGAGYVIDSKPKPRTSAPKGSTVTLSVV